MPTPCSTGTPCLGENYYKVCVGAPATNCNCECQSTPFECPGGTVLQDCAFGVCTCVSPTPGPSGTVTKTATATPTPTPPAISSCIGACTSSNAVYITDLLLMVNIALNGDDAGGSCPDVAHCATS